MKGTSVITATAKFELHPDLEPVRKRPGMYIGDPDERGLETYALEVIASAINDFQNGHGHRINVTLLPDGSISIRDFGCPLESNLDPEFGRPIVELRLATLNFEAYKFPVRASGMLGVGLPCVNALSEFFEAESYCDGRRHSIRFERGNLVEPLRKRRGTKAEGNLFTFKPDPLIFPEPTFIFDDLAARFEALAFLNAGLVIHLADQRAGKKRCRAVTFCFPKGISDFVQQRANRRGRLLKKPITFTKAASETTIEAAIQFDDTDNRMMLTYLNFFPARKGGTPVEGFLAGLRTAAKTLFASRPGWRGSGFRARNLQRGITVVLKITHPRPQYFSATKDRICNRDMYFATERLTHAGITEFFEAHPEEVGGFLSHFCNRDDIYYRSRYGGELEA